MDKEKHKKRIKQLDKDVDIKKYKNKNNDREIVIGHDKDKFQDEINDTA